MNESDHPAVLIYLEIESKGFNRHLSNELSETERVSNVWRSYSFRARTASIQTLIDVAKAPCRGALFSKFDNKSGEVFWRGRKRRTEEVKSVIDHR